ncbi:MAG: hypothetical protein NTAFB05_01070 [Nitrobacter sp.]|uniref:hypothetical protein n=1 Tax=Nitrobacter sp. TaxID=29420 RepID=UPI00387DFE06
MAYALFYHDQRIGAAAPTEIEAWRRALRSGLIADIPVSDERGGQVLPHGLHVKQIVQPDQSGGPRGDQAGDRPGIEGRG